MAMNGRRKGVFQRFVMSATPGLRFTGGKQALLVSDPATTRYTSPALHSTFLRELALVLSRSFGCGLLGTGI